MGEIRYHGLLVTDSVQKRFWAKVDRSGKCWLWTGSSSRGYGTIRLTTGVIVYAHRLSYAIHRHGDIKDLQVCHVCDTPLCVNPAHLFEGTAFDNSLDAWSKGRAVLPGNAPRGETHHSAKLSEVSVSKIRSLLSAGESMASVARRFGVSTQAIFNIKNGRSWATTK